MNIFDFEKKCSGCAVCVDTCPVDAITITQDEDGFYVPYLNSQVCINCEKCVKVCPALDSEIPITQREFFYGWNNDETIRSVSSSGGIFNALAQEVIDNGGFVFSAAYSDDFKSVIITSTQDVPLSKMRTSKYVQSNAMGACREMERLLKEGKKVLFCASPCQVAGAKKFFEDKYENLILVDFLCGGFPSPAIYSEYIKWLERKKNSKVTDINFRDKRNGWSKSGIRVDFENGKEYFSSPVYDPYYYYYGTHFMRNKSCLGCKFRESRFADITIADFWGFREMKLPNDEKGMSLIITYTLKGKKFLDDIKRKLTLFQISEEYGSYGFEPNDKTAEELQQREDFLRKIRENGFIETAKQDYYKNGKFGIICRKVTNKLKRLFVKL